MVQNDQTDLRGKTPAAESPAVQLTRLLKTRAAAFSGATPDQRPEDRNFQNVWSDLLLRHTICYLFPHRDKQVAVS